MDPKKLVAEAIGTFWLTFGGCGSAVIAAAFPHVGIGLLGVSLAFGLTLLTMAYSIGHVSGCHINPAVTIGLAAGGRFPASQIGPYIVAQVIGAIIGAALLYVIARGAPDFTLANGFAANGYGACDVVRPAVWDNSNVSYWYRQNCILYVKGARGVAPASLDRRHPGRFVNPWCVVELYQRAIRLGLSPQPVAEGSD